MLVVALVACSGSPSTFDGSGSIPTSNLASPTIDAMATLAQACQTYQDFVRYAHHDILKSTRTNAEIVAQLRKFQDSLEGDAQALHDEGVADVARPTQAMADAIGHWKNAIQLFGETSQITINDIKKAGKAGQDLLAVCPA
jgi:hypothetical protein